jgi:hypothetical protein
MNRRRYRRWLIALPPHALRVTCATVAAAMLLGARPLAAQYQAPPAGIHRPTLPLEVSGSRIDPTPLLPPNPVNGRGLAHGVLIGAGVGAAVGIVVVAATPHSSHEDDAMGYIIGATLGAFVGMVVGGAIGASR